MHPVDSKKKEGHRGPVILKLNRTFGYDINAPITAVFKTVRNGHIEFEPGQMQKEHNPTAEIGRFELRRPCALAGIST